MRVEFLPRPDVGPLGQLADGFIFLSGGIFQLIERVGMAADANGFGGKVRIEVVTRDLLDGALEPLAAQYDEDELERAVGILSAAIERVGREFFSEEYEEGSQTGGGNGRTSGTDGSA
jgi:hypothetical protein